MYHFLGLEERYVQNHRAHQTLHEELKKAQTVTEKRAVDVKALFLEGKSLLDTAQREVEAMNKDKVQLQETLNKIKLENMNAVDKPHKEGYNTTLEEGVEQFAPIRVRLYQVGYNLGLEATGVSVDNVLRTHVEILEDFKDVPTEEEAGNNDDAKVAGDPVDEAQN